MQRRLLFFAVAVAVIGGAAVGSVSAAQRTFAWVLGDSVASIGQQAGSNDLQVTAQGDVDFRAAHLRFMSQSGAFELDVPAGQQAQLNAYFLGTPTRTPIELADDGQGVTPLIVAGSTGQSADLQDWLLGDTAAAAIDGKGRLRLGQVTISAAIVKGVATLYATGPKGQRTVVARGRPSK